MSIRNYIKIFVEHELDPDSYEFKALVKEYEGNYTNEKNLKNLYSAVRKYTTLYSLRKQQKDKIEDIKKQDQVNKKQDQVNKKQDQVNKKKDHDIKINRLRNDIRSDRISSIANALGIPIPDGLIKQARQYNYAVEDKKRIEDRAKNAERELTEKEQAEVFNLDEIIEKTKPANDLIEKFHLNVDKVSAFAGVAIPVLGGVIVAFKLISAVIKKINKLGREFISTYNKANKSNEIYGETLNKTTDSVDELAGRVKNRWEKIKESIGGFLVDSGIYGFGLGIADTYESAYMHFVMGENTPPEQNERALFTDLEYTEMRNRHIAAIADNNEDLSAAEYIVDSLYDSAKNSVYWDNYNNNKEDIEEFFSSLIDAVENGKNLSNGVDTTDNVLTGYLASLGLNPMMDYYSDSELDALRVRLAEEQLRLATEKGVDSIRKQNQEWQKQGELINECKDALLSFDEVEVLGGKSTDILDLGQATDTIEGDAEKVKEALGQAGDEFGNRLLNSSNRAFNSINSRFTYLNHLVGGAGKITPSSVLKYVTEPLVNSNDPISGTFKMLEKSFGLVDILPSAAKGTGEYLKLMTKSDNNTQLTPSNFNLEVNFNGTNIVDQISKDAFVREIADSTSRMINGGGLGFNSRTNLEQ